MHAYNFSERVRHVLATAREEAHNLNHEYIGTEHVLLGLTGEGDGVATAVMNSLGADVGRIRQTIFEVVKRGTPTRDIRGELPYTSRAKKALEFAMAEANEFKHGYVGTEHLLLGLVREGKGIAAQVLNDEGMDLDAVRAETLRLLGDEAPTEDQEPRPTERPGPASAESHSGNRVSLEQLRSRCTPRLQVVLHEAVGAASRRAQAEVQSEHLLEALLAEKDGMAVAILDRLGVDRERLRGETSEAAAAIGPATGARRPASLSTSAIAVLRHARQEMSGRRLLVMGTDDLLIALTRLDGGAARILGEAAITTSLVRGARDRLVG